jgi:hypothetical protein
VRKEQSQSRDSIYEIKKNFPHDAADFLPPSFIGGANKSATSSLE